MTSHPSDAARLTAEFTGTALLLTLVVGSGIAVSVDGAASVQLFIHAVVVGAGLAALIVVFGPVSGAHFNPVVTIADWWLARLSTRRAVGYVVAQLLGAATGVLLTHASFGVQLVQIGTAPRPGGGLVVGEAIATAGLLLVIVTLVHVDRVTAVPAAVGAWIGAAIVATSSASFANPAVTLARVLTDTWTGIAPAAVPRFLGGQTLGLLAAVWLTTLLLDVVPSGAMRPTDDPPTPEDDHAIA